MAAAVLTEDHAARPPLADGKPLAVRLWLASVAVLVLAALVAGGATRLTDSGLSITEWQPILGAIPPLTEAGWQAAFEKYKQIPEYAIVNRGMTLAGFKTIYWWEWGHRLLGRLIGVAFAVPFLVFWLRGRFAPGLALKLLGLLALGGFQGAIGWYMVSSGLVDRIDVSQYRLALHLTMAFVILGLLVWLALPETGRPSPAAPAHRRRAFVLTAAILLQVVLGAFVAGLHAGRAYNTWPLMDGRLVPDAIGALEPWYLNLTENIATVQFVHRLAAYAIVLLAAWHIPALWRQQGALPLPAAVLAVALALQVGLGIWAVLAAAPLPLALAHQAGAALLWIAAVWYLHGLAGGRR